MEWKVIDDDPVPKDGSWFMICNKFEGYSSYETGKFDPLNGPRFVEVGGGLFRKETMELYEWRGFNNMQRATHWRHAPEPPKC